MSALAVLVVGALVVAQAPASATSTTSTTSTTSPSPSSSTVAASPAVDAARATAPPARLRVLVMDLRAGAGSEEVARAAANLLAVEVQRTGRFDVVTAADVRALIEQEANRQAIGCDVSSSSCMAEIAGELGADRAFYGDVTKLGALYVITVSFFDARTSNALTRTSIEVSDVAELPSALRRAMPELLDAAEPLTPEPEGKPMGGLSIVGLVTTGAGIVVGGAGFGWALWMDGYERSPSSTREQKQLAFDTHVAAGIGTIVGAAALVTGAAMFVVGAVSE